jgi:hypothetical protein
MTGNSSFSPLKFTDMKRVTLIVALLLVVGAGVFAAVPAPEKGYWELITMETGAARTTVKFFDLQNHLIYEEHLEGVRLDPGKRKVCKMLNRSLQAALAAWEKK